MGATHTPYHVARLTDRDRKLLRAITEGGSAIQARHEAGVTVTDVDGTRWHAGYVTAERLVRAGLARRAVTDRGVVYTARED